MDFVIQFFDIIFLRSDNIYGISFLQICRDEEDNSKSLFGLYYCDQVLVVDLFFHEVMFYFGDEVD